MEQMHQDDVYVLHQYETNSLFKIKVDSFVKDTLSQYDSELTIPSFKILE